MQIERSDPHPSDHEVLPSWWVEASRNCTTCVARLHARTRYNTGPSRPSTTDVRFRESVQSRSAMNALAPFSDARARNSEWHVAPFSAFSNCDCLAVACNAYWYGFKIIIATVWSSRIGTALNHERVLGLQHNSCWLQAIIPVPGEKAQAPSNVLCKRPVRRTAYCMYTDSIARTLLILNWLACLNHYASQLIVCPSRPWCKEWSVGRGHESKLATSGSQHHG